MSKLLDSLCHGKTTAIGFYASVVVSGMVSMITTHSQTDLPISNYGGQPGKPRELTSSILGSMDTVS